MVRILSAILLTGAFILGAMAEISLSATARSGANFGEIVVPTTVGGLSTATNVTVVVRDAVWSDLVVTNGSWRVAGNGSYRFSFDGLPSGRSYQVSVSVGDTSVSCGEVDLRQKTDAVWFSISPNSDVSACEWNAIPPVGASAYWLSPTDTARMKVTENCPSSFSKVETRVEFLTALKESDLELASVENEVSQAQSALTIVADDAGSLSWRCWNGSSWRNLGAVETLGVYTVRMERDETNGVFLMRHSVKGLGEDSFRVLGDWISVDDGQRSTEIAFLGEGKLSSVMGMVPDCAVAQVGENRYETLSEALKQGQSEVTLLADVRIGLAGLASGSYAINANGNALSWTDGGKSATFVGSTLTVSDGVSSDGISSYERQVLNIPEGENLRLTHESTDRADTIRFSLANHVPLSGSDLQIELEESRTSNFSGSQKTLLPSSTADVLLDDDVKYYRMNIRVNE